MVSEHTGGLDLPRASLDSRKSCDSHGKSLHCTPESSSFRPSLDKQRSLDDVLATQPALKVQNPAMKFVPLVDKALPKSPIEDNINPFAKANSLGNFKVASYVGKSIKSFSKFTSGITTRTTTVSHSGGSTVPASKPPVPKDHANTTPLILEFPPMIFAEQLFLIELDVAVKVKPMEILQNIESYATRNSILFDEKSWIQNRTCLTVWSHWIREYELASLVTQPESKDAGILNLPEIVSSFERVCTLFLSH